MSMITSSQLRAARALLRWSAHDLAHEAGIGSATIQRYEVSPGIPRGNTKTLIDIQKTLEAAGVEFIGTPDNNPGVRLLTGKVDADN